MGRVLFSVLLATSVHSAALSQAPRTIAQDAQTFGKRDGAWSVDISPSGTRAIMLMSGPAGSTIAKIIDLNTTQSKNILGAKGGRENLDWCNFASDDYLVCRYSGLDTIDGKLIPFSRLAAVKADGSSMKMLGQKASAKDDSLRQFDGRIIDWLTEDGGSVLMAREYVRESGTTGTNVARSDSGMGVDKITLATMKVTQVENPKDDADDYMTDGQGNVRIKITEDSFDNNLTGRYRYRFRKPGSKTWEMLGASGVGAASIYPQAIEAQSNSVLVLKNKDGRDALYRVALDGSGTTTLVAADPRVDIDGVIRVGRGQKVIGYTFNDNVRHSVYFDPEYDKLAKSLGKALGKYPLINVEGSSRDGSKLLVFAGADSHPGTYFVLDRTTKKMQELAAVRSNLDGRALASVKSISYAARDGKQIPAYLTLPVGSSGKDLPAVVLPHGGPTSRDEWGFDWLAQFLAARGYAVIQPQFRGSSGYGQEFQNKNAILNWQTAMNDISDSARYLVKEGIADTNRLAIMGWSYGGYAALQSAAIDPSLYKAAIAIAPVTDLDLLKKEAEGYTNYALVKATVGSGPHVAAGSPLRRVQEIRVPVLLFHGTNDINVGVAQSQKMDAALRAAGKKSEFVKYDGLDHQLDDSNARADMLNRIGIALDAAVGH